MIGKAVTLGLAGLAAAVPTPPTVVPHYPDSSISKGFNLVVNVTDPSRDLSPSIQNTFVTSIHVGAGLNMVGNTADIGGSRIFYVNGTDNDVFYGQSRILTDGGTPPFPEGLSLAKDDDNKYTSTARLDAGVGELGFGLTRFPNPYAIVSHGVWFACKQEIPYYPGDEFVVIKQAEPDVGLPLDGHVPKGCAPVTLVPQCAELNELPKGSTSSHKFAADSKCYADVASIKWSEYGP